MKKSNSKDRIGKIKSEYLMRIESLSTRELEVLQLYINGSSSREIIEKFQLDPSTLSTHRTNISRKLEKDKLSDWFLIAKAFNLFD